MEKVRFLAIGASSESLKFIIKCDNYVAFLICRTRQSELNKCRCKILQAKKWICEKNNASTITPLAIYFVRACSLINIILVPLATLKVKVILTIA